MKETQDGAYNTAVDRKFSKTIQSSNLKIVTHIAAD